MEPSKPNKDAIIPTPLSAYHVAMVALELMKLDRGLRLEIAMKMAFEVLADYSAKIDALNSQ